jgi:hypothetical protein
VPAFIALTVTDQKLLDRQLLDGDFETVEGGSLFVVHVGV